MSRFHKMRAISVHDHHDVTDEDVRADLYGDDYHFWSDVDRNRPENRRSSAINRMMRAATQAERDAIADGKPITLEMLRPFESNGGVE